MARHNTARPDAGERRALGVYATPPALVGYLCWRRPKSAVIWR